MGPTISWWTTAAVVIVVVVVGPGGLCGGGPFADAIVARTGGGVVVNGSSAVSVGSQQPDGLETSQTIVDHKVHQRRPNGYGNSENQRSSAKDYGYGAETDGGYRPSGNTYGPPPPRDHYYDDGEYGRPYRDQRFPAHPNHDDQYYYYYAAGDDGHHPQHGAGGVSNVQPLLWPLAGVTLLGLLSALIKTPLLLHLGHVGHKRRRRNADTTEGRRVRRQYDRRRTCLVCDTVTRNSVCVQRSVCEAMSGNGTDKRLLAAMIGRVTRTERRTIPGELSGDRLKAAETAGRSGADCGTLYPCGGDGNGRQNEERNKQLQ